MLLCDVVASLWVELKSTKSSSVGFWAQRSGDPKPYLHVGEGDDPLAVVFGRGKQVLEDVGHPLAQLAGEALEDEVRVRL